MMQVRQRVPSVEALDSLSLDCLNALGTSGGLSVALLAIRNTRSFSTVASVGPLRIVEMKARA
jgi:hypothetical protein